MPQRRSRSIVQEMSLHFAVQLVNYSRRLRKDNTDLVLTRQLLRSGTSIGANVEEALGGQSSKDFTSKLAGAGKEAREAGYWLRLIQETQPHNHPELAGELVTMLNHSILTTRSRFAAADSRLQFRTYNTELGEAVDSEPSSLRKNYVGTRKLRWSACGAAGWHAQAGKCGTKEEQSRRMLTKAVQQGRSE